MKRNFDVVIGLGVLAVAAPVMALIALAIRFDSPGPIFYVCRRVGLGGREFGMLKFRTMIAGDGPAITLRDDPRVTRFGGWLRKTKLDELPQLVNVVRGEMSLVGPRPEDPRYVARYTAEERRLLSVRPGMTSAASLGGWNESERLAGGDWERQYCDETLPAKLASQLDDLEHTSLAHDLAVLARTVVAISRGSSGPDGPHYKRRY